MKNEKFISLLPIETERLIIKKTSTNDIEFMLKTDKQEETLRFVGGIKNYTREERISFLERKAEKFNNNIAGSLTVYLKENNIPIGLTGLSINENNNNAEISYIFDYDYTSKGYCTEVCKKLIDIAFNTLELNKVYAEAINENISSIKVLEKLNFKYEGTRKEQVYNKELDKYYDFVDYGLLKSEYEKSHY